MLSQIKTLMMAKLTITMCNKLRLTCSKELVLFAGVLKELNTTVFVHGQNDSFLRQVYRHQREHCQPPL